MLKVNGQYVSIIKSNLKASGAKGRKVRVKKAGPRTFSTSAHGLAPIDAALSFIRACGGLEQAKAVLTQVEAISAAL